MAQPDPIVGERTVAPWPAPSRVDVVSVATVVDVPVPTDRTIPTPAVRPHSKEKP